MSFAIWKLMFLGFTCPKSEGNYGTWHQWPVNNCLHASVRETLFWVTGDPHAQNIHGPGIVLNSNKQTNKKENLKSQFMNNFRQKLPQWARGALRTLTVRNLHGPRGLSSGVTSPYRHLVGFEAVQDSWSFSEEKKDCIYCFQLLINFGSCSIQTDKKTKMKMKT